MSTYASNGSLLSRLVMYFLVALIAIAALKMAFWVLGVAVGLGTMILFTVGPILLVGWLTVKLYGWLTRSNGYE